MDPEFSKVFLSALVKKRPRKFFKKIKDVEIEAKNGDLGLGHGHQKVVICDRRLCRRRRRVGNTPSSRNF